MLTNRTAHFYKLAHEVHTLRCTNAFVTLARYLHTGIMKYHSFVGINRISKWCLLDIDACFGRESKPFISLEIMTSAQQR